MHMRARLAFNRFRGYAKHRNVRIPLDRRIISKNVEKGLLRAYEDDEARASQRLLRDGDAVLELGAGLGFTSAFIRLNTRVGRMVAYEANPALIDYIAKTHRANGISDIEIRHGVVLARPTAPEVTFYVRPDMYASSLTPGGGKVVHTLNVPTYAWDDVLSDVRPTAVVCDIEGGELDLFEQADFRSVRRLIADLHPAIYGMQGMARIFAAMERSGFRYRDPWRGHVIALERGGESRPD